jgi:hypothetical protein
MANDAFQLQGLNGGVAIAAGQTFYGVSRGLQVIAAADFSYDLVNPHGQPVPVSAGGISAGVFFGGQVTEIAVSTGTVVAFPTSTDYTVV